MYIFLFCMFTRYGIKVEFWNLIFPIDVDD